VRYAAGLIFLITSAIISGGAAPSTSPAFKSVTTQTITATQGGAITGATISSGETSQSLATIYSGAPARTLQARAQDIVNVKDFGAKCDDSTDDAAAFQSAINFVLALPNGGEVEIPDGQCNINEPLTATVTTSASNTARVLTIAGSGGLHGAKLQFPASFTGTGLAITITSGGTVVATSPAVDLENLTFLSNTASVIGTGISVTASSAMMGPSLRVNNVSFANIGAGSWASGLTLFAMNITRLSHITCMGFTGTSSTCVSYDTNSSISVDHDIDDLYMNGGGTGLLIGHTGGTGPLQGFTVRRPSFTNTASGIQYLATSGADELIVSDGQINTSGIGIYTTGVTTVNLHHNYFLGNQTAISIAGGNGVSITGNSISANVTQPPGATNTGILLTDLVTSFNRVNVVSGNSLSNFFAPQTSVGGAAITLAGATGNTLVTGNMINPGSDVPIASNNATGTGNIIAGNGTNSASGVVNSPTYQTSTPEIFTGVPTFDANVSGQTSGFPNEGLSFGWNQSASTGENDIFLGPQGGAGGLSIFQLNSSGAIVGSSPIVKLDNLGNLSITSVQTPVLTVATLPVCNSTKEGTRLGVTDATVANFLGALTGGGTIHTPVYCNGSIWVEG